jgi:hypothetical protein
MELPAMRPEAVVLPAFQHKNAISALALKRQPEVSSGKTAAWAHKLMRQTMRQREARYLPHGQKLIMLTSEASEGHINGGASRGQQDRLRRGRADPHRCKAASTCA